jgi:hypothetical protein
MRAQLTSSPSSSTSSRPLVPSSFIVAPRAHSAPSINDYGIEGIGTKSDTLYNVTKGFLADGVPLDAIGFQCHFTLGQVPSTLQANLQRFADLGLDVAITELDINIPGAKNATAFEQQAKDYWTVVNACVSTNRCVSVVSAGCFLSFRGDNGSSSVCRACGACRTTIRGSPMALSSRGTQRSSLNQHSMRSRTRSRGSRSRRSGRRKSHRFPLCGVSFFTVS